MTNKEYVTVRGKKYYMRNGRLDLRRKGIKQISDIVGLDALTNLTSLSLDNNQITAISGLDTLTNLKFLSLNNNQITAISGLATLTNLSWLDLDGNQITAISGLATLAKIKILYLDENQIPANMLAKIQSIPGGSFGQKCVQYCETSFQSRDFRHPTSYTDLNQVDLLEKFEKIIKMSQKVKISTVAKSLNITDDELFENLLKWNEKLPFKIFEDFIIVENLNLFIQSLDGQFADWEQEEQDKLEKK